MRNIILYTIITLFSVAFCFETIDYCYEKMNDSTFCQLHDIDCEENESENEKSNEKTEKTDAFEDMLLDKDQLSYITSIKQQAIKSHIHHFPCDYSKVIYSPPEITLS
ncbi:MAG: hypothetical protein M3R27_04115 [Bacteroidota bacterium]|nr:hypothetical protein [Bacteroidota bacterium]